VADGLQENIHDIKEIFIEFEVLEKETKYILSNLDIHNEEIFDFLKRISRMTYNFRDFDPEKDDVKSLMSFLWSIFAGWSRITGYPEEDIFEVILRDL